MIGIVQQAFPITLHGRDVPEEEILEAHLAASAAFLGAGCDLVIWPEAMLPTGLNEGFLAFDLIGSVPKAGRTSERCSRWPARGAPVGAVGLPDPGRGRYVALQLDRGGG